MMSIDAAINECVDANFRAEIRAIIQVESSGNANAIALIGGGRMLVQPTNEEQAKKTLLLLDDLGIHYAAGIAQINRVNFNKYGVEHNNVFNVCKNLQVAQSILNNCRILATQKFDNFNFIRQASWSCYYSGNFKEGFEKKRHKYSYVERMLKVLNYDIRSYSIKNNTITRGGDMPDKETSNSINNYQSSNIFEQGNE